MSTQSPADHRSTFKLDKRLLRFRLRPEAEEPSMLAQDLLAADRAHEAFGVIQDALDREPDDADLLLTQGLAFLERGHLPWAQLLLTRAAKLEPEWIEPLRWLGEVLVRRERFGRAADVAERALGLDGSDNQLLALRRRAERSGGLGLRLSRFHRDHEREDPAMLAQELIEAGRPKEAIEVVRAVLPEEGDDADLLLLEAQACKAIGDLDAAELSLTRAAFTDPKWKEPWRHLGEVLLERGALKEARQVVQRGLSYDDGDDGLKALAGKIARLCAKSRYRTEAKPAAAAVEAKVAEPSAKPEVVEAKPAVLAPEPEPEAVEPEPVAAPEPAVVEPAPVALEAAPEPEVVVAPEPVAVAPQPVAVAPEPVAVAPEPEVVVAPEPVAVAAPEPEVVEPDPVVLAAEPEPERVEPEPVAVAAPEPVAVAPEPVAVAPEPEVIEPEPIVRVEEPVPVRVLVQRPVRPMLVVIPDPEPVPAELALDELALRSLSAAPEPAIDLSVILEPLALEDVRERVGALPYAVAEAPADRIELAVGASAEATLPGVGIALPDDIEATGWELDCALDELIAGLSSTDDRALRGRRRAYRPPAPSELFPRLPEDPGEGQRADPS